MAQLIGVAVVDKMPAFQRFLEGNIFAHTEWSTRQLLDPVPPSSSSVRELGALTSGTT